MKALTKFFGILLAIFLLVVWFFFDNIKGYYTFKEYCEKEGGLKVYEPLEKNVGWLADDKSSAMSASLLGDISFVRFFDKNGSAFDVKYIGGSNQSESSYQIISSENIDQPKYHWTFVNKNIDSQLRLKRYGYEVYRIGQEKPDVTFYIYGYEKFNRDKTILDMPSEIYCHVDDKPRALDELTLALIQIKKSFND